MLQTVSPEHWICHSNLLNFKLNISVYNTSKNARALLLLIATHPYGKKLLRDFALLRWGAICQDIDLKIFWLYKAQAHLGSTLQHHLFHSISLVSNLYLKTKTKSVNIFIT
jgi:hypothetical protein